MVERVVGRQNLTRCESKLSLSYAHTAHRWAWRQSRQRIRVRFAETVKRNSLLSILSRLAVKQDTFSRPQSGMYGLLEWETEAAPPRDQHDDAALFGGGRMTGGELVCRQDFGPGAGWGSSPPRLHHSSTGSWQSG